MDSAEPVEAIGQLARTDRRATHLKIVRLTSASEGLFVLPLAEAWHAESRYSHLPFSEQKFVKLMMATLDRKERGAGYFVTYRGEVVGLINIAVGEAWLAEGGCYATCLAWYVDPRVRRSLLGGRVATLMIQQAKHWAKDRGATELLLHGTHDAGVKLERRGGIIGTNVTITLDAGVNR